MKKLISKVRQKHDIVHLSSKVRSVEGRMSLTNALDSQMQQGEGDRVQPVHRGT